MGDASELDQNGTHNLAEGALPKKAGDPGFTTTVLWEGITSAASLARWNGETGRPSMQLLRLPDSWLAPVMGIRKCTELPGLPVTTTGYHHLLQPRQHGTMCISNGLAPLTITSHATLQKDTKYTSSKLHNFSHIR